MKHEALDRFFSEKGVYLFDGGMGSMLQNKGLSPGQPPERMSLEQPKVVQDVHRKYIEAGADLIETNTFGGNRAVLSRYGLEDKIEEINKIAAEVALEVAPSDVKVVGSIGPTGHLLAPLGEIDQDQVEKIYYEQSQILINSGINLVNVETMNDLRELKAAVIAARSCGLSVMAEATIMDNGYTLSGASAEVIIATLEALGVVAGGLNCGLGPTELRPVIKRMSKVSLLPLVLQPNAGLPQVIDEETVYPLTAERFGEKMRAIIEEAHPRIIGGCCGTTPEHIKVLRSIIDSLPSNLLQATQEKTDKPILIAGRGKTVNWNKNWDEYAFLEVKPINCKTIQTPQGTADDLFSVITLLKKNKIELVRLDLSCWEAEPSEIKKFIQEFQLYFTGPFSVKGNKIEILSEFFHYYLGKPLYESTQSPVPASIMECIDKYLPGTIIC